MLLRAWLFLGLICAGLQMAGFFYVLHQAPAGAPATRPASGTPLHHAYQQATTMTFFGMVVCQIGTAFAARTERASLRSIGVFTNRLLLWGIAFELVLAALFIYTPPFQSLLGTAALDPGHAAVRRPVPVHRLGRRRAAPLPPPPQGRPAHGQSAAVAGRESMRRDPVPSVIFQRRDQPRANLHCKRQCS